MLVVTLSHSDQGPGPRAGGICPSLQHLPLISHPACVSAHWVVHISWYSPSQPYEQLAYSLSFTPFLCLIHLTLGHFRMCLLSTLSEKAKPNKYYDIKQLTVRGNLCPDMSTYESQVNENIKHVDRFVYLICVLHRSHEYFT